MRNLKVVMSYNGTAYHGFQSQSNAIAIQDVVQAKIAQLLKQPVLIHGCSRTDTGVHAKAFVFNFHTESKIPNQGFIKGMNTVLPEDIAFASCEDVPEDFHARFSSKGKEYIYVVNNSGRRDVFGKDLSMNHPLRLDEEKLDAAAKLFVGKHNFAAFCKAEAKQNLKSTERTIYDFRVIRDGENVYFIVSGDGFLHNMVRILVGTLIYINDGKRCEKDIIDALSTGERDCAGMTLPPCGLYLNKVFY